jgi:acyl-CoA dehydrogenase
MTDNQLSQAATALFDEFCSWETVGRAESAGWAGELWQILQQTGFTDVPVPDSLGGSDGSVADAAQLLRTAGAHGAPVPLAEAGLIGGWLLTAAGLSLPDGVRTALPPSAGSLRLEGNRLFGTVSAVAWGHRAHYVVGLVDGVVILAPGPAATNQRPTVSRAVNLADEARDTLTFDGVPVTALAAAPEGVTADSLADRAALARAALMAGALSAVADLTLRYSRDRRQFGRPIGEFQAVKAHLVTVHQQARLATEAVDGAVCALERGRGGFEIACAKVIADLAAVAGSRAAHQVHGAIGMTREYPLQYLTRRLWAWRDEAGGHQHWADRLGAALVEAGPDALYPAIQSGMEVFQ